MGLTYDNLLRLRQKHSIKSDSEKALKLAKEVGFPNCKGLYPDCPEKPDKNNPMCKNCPVLDKE
jgi:hypothetical protein